MADKTVSDPIPLKGTLQGCSIVLDLDNVDLGFLEDIESDRMRDRINAICQIIVGGRLPNGTDRAGIRKLKPDNLVDLANGISEAFKTPKNG